MEAKLTMLDELLSQMVLNSLPSSFGSFIITYNQRKEKWSINEIITKCDQEEKRMRKEGILVVNHVKKNLKGEI